jgi:NitT/TauT family transport system ATP-binding protein
MNNTVQGRTGTASVSAAASAVAVLDVRRMGVSFEGGGKAKEILRDVSFRISAKEFVCIVGPSGAGKTTLVRCLAGLSRPTSGTVLLDGEPVVGPPARLALVAQDYSRSLMPWLRVRDNVRLPLRGKGISAAEQNARVARALGAVGLPGAEELYPRQLSGGMQQRVSIARALAYDPEILIMDEPFASVDAQTRAELEDLIMQLQRASQLSVVLITHDIDESVYLSDRILVLGGRPAGILQEYAIDLGQTRDQLETKALRAFAEYRSEVFRSIQAASAMMRKDDRP